MVTLWQCLSILRDHHLITPKLRQLAIQQMTEQAKATENPACIAILGRYLGELPPDVEDLLKEYPGDLAYYACLVHKRFPEQEAAIARSSYAGKYAVEVLGLQFQ